MSATRATGGLGDFYVLEADTKYPHLFYGRCSCGARTFGAVPRDTVTVLLGCGHPYAVDALHPSEMSA